MSASHRAAGAVHLDQNAHVLSIGLHGRKGELAGELRLLRTDERIATLGLGPCLQCRDDLLREFRRDRGRSHRRALKHGLGEGRRGLIAEDGRMVEQNGADAVEQHPRQHQKARVKVDSPKEDHEGSEPVLPSNGGSISVRRRDGGHDFTPVSIVADHFVAGPGAESPPGRQWNAIPHEPHGAVH